MITKQQLRLAALVAGALAAAPAAAQTTLTYSSWVPPSHHLSHWQVNWANTVEKATGGRVKFQLLPKHPSSPPGTFDAVSDGLMDLSYVTASYTPARHVFPLMAELPGAGNTAEVNSVAYSRIHWKHFHKFGEYNGVKISQDTLHIFAGLCAVDTKEHIDLTFAALQKYGIVTTRAGAYKPRTSPYDFQGMGATCLPWLFESAGKHGIKIITMEVTHESHVDEIRRALAATGNPTGVMLQIGTRNAQNFELLKAVGARPNRTIRRLCQRFRRFHPGLQRPIRRRFAGDDKRKECLLDESITI